VLTYTEKNEVEYRGATLGKAEVEGPQVKYTCMKIAK
jgi:hypothetical protein